MPLFPSLEHSEAIAGILAGLISIPLYLKEQGSLLRGPNERESDRVWPISGAVRYTQHLLSLPPSTGTVHGTPKQVQ